MQEKSRASLMTGETAVLTIAADISCVTCWRRLRITSSVTGSRTGDLDDEVAVRRDLGAVARGEKDRRVPALDHGGADERHAGREALAVVDRHAGSRVRAGEPERAGATTRDLGIRGRRCGRR